MIKTTQKVSDLIRSSLEKIMRQIDTKIFDRMLVEKNAVIRRWFYWVAVMSKTAMQGMGVFFRIEKQRELLRLVRDINEEKLFFTADALGDSHV